MYNPVRHHAACLDMSYEALDDPLPTPATAHLIYRGWQFNFERSQFVRAREWDFVASHVYERRQVISFLALKLGNLSRSHPFSWGSSRVLSVLEYHDLADLSCAVGWWWRSLCAYNMERSWANVTGVTGSVWGTYFLSLACNPRILSACA